MLVSPCEGIIILKLYILLSLSIYVATVERTSVDRVLAFGLFMHSIGDLGIL